MTFDADDLQALAEFLALAAVSAEDEDGEVSAVLLFRAKGKQLSLSTLTSQESIVTFLEEAAQIEKSKGC